MKAAQKTVCILLVVLLAVGAFMTGYGAVMYARENYIKNNYVYEYAVVSHKQENSKGGDDYELSYNAEGNNYTCVYEKANSKTYIGETVDIYYEAGNPESIHIATGDLYKYILIEGILIAVFSLIILAVIVTPVIIRHRLVKANKWAMCKVVRVKRNSKNTCRIYCDSSKFPKRNGKPFVSAPVKGKLPKNIKESALTVYYSEKNPNFYFVDTEKLS